MPNIFQNSFSSTRKAAPPEKLKPELFLEKLEFYQTAHKAMTVLVCAVNNQQRDHTASQQLLRSTSQQPAIKLPARGSPSPVGDATTTTMEDGSHEPSFSHWPVGSAVGFPNNAHALHGIYGRAVPRRVPSASLRRILLRPDCTCITTPRP